MNPGGAKNKGANGERELAGILDSWARSIDVKLELKRNLEQTRGGGHDLVGLEEYGLAVEVKRVEQNAINSWWSQAVRQAVKVNSIPVLAHRKNRQPWRFRVRAWVYPCQCELDVDMEAEQFKKWFISHLQRRGK